MANDRGTRCLTRPRNHRAGLHPEAGRITVVDRRPVAMTVEVGGEIDYMSRPALDRAVELIRSSGTASPIVVDLSAVTFADSTLARLLLGLERLAREFGVPIRASGATPETRWLLRLLDLDRLTVGSLFSAAV